MQSKFAPCLFKEDKPLSGPGCCRAKPQVWGQKQNIRKYHENHANITVFPITTLHSLMHPTVCPWEWTAGWSLEPEWAQNLMIYGPPVTVLKVSIPLTIQSSWNGYQGCWCNRCGFSQADGYYIQAHQTSCPSRVLTHT